MERGFRHVESGPLVQRGTNHVREQAEELG
jgi:hypothetical protein